MSTQRTATERTVQCPTCGEKVVWGPQSPFRPFCSQRCKMNDLGAWATERYRVPATQDSPDSDEGTDQSPRSSGSGLN